MKLLELVEKIGGTLDGELDIEIKGVAAIHEAADDEVTFLSNNKYAPLAASTKAGAIIVSKDWNGDCPAAKIRTDNPDAAFAQAATLFYRPVPLPPPGIHPSAVVADDVTLGNGVVVGPLSVIEAGSVVGENTVISAQSYVGHQVHIGANSFLYPQVSVRESCVIGDRVIIHNGAVIGSDGFGYSVDEKGVRTKIQQIGIVEIGDDVEIGANVTVDRARFGKTTIGRGTKIDNLVQIAHNVNVGENCVIIAQVALAGSCSIGDRTIIAGQSAVAGHIHVGSDVVVGGKTGVTKDVESGTCVMGMPAVSESQYKRSLASVALLPKLKKRVAALEKEIRK
jgi:UDP-3-O-[3-hydroxymyristoyl] glucosamine N-acyltransferase